MDSPNACVLELTKIVGSGTFGYIVLCAYVVVSSSVFQSVSCFVLLLI